MHYNQVELAGNLTRDVQLRYIPSGTAVADFGLAVTRKWKSQGEWQEYTSFFDVTLWGNTAERANETRKKGDNVFVVGELRHERWEDQAGNPRSKVRINARKVLFIQAPKNRREVPNEYGEEKPQKPVERSELPF